MQEQRQRYRQNASSQRSIAREVRSPSVMFTALTVGAVVLLLAVTFAADWLRTPELNITNASPFLSPNHDNSYDNATVNYQLSEEAEVSARVFSEGGGIIRSLIISQKESPGQHFLVWNGMDDNGRQVADGMYRLEISARGAARSRSASASIQVDTQPPTLQLLNMQDGARVREELLNVEGVTEPNAVIWLAGSAQSVAVDGAGRFRTEQKLHNGSNTIEVKAIDPAGNSNTISRTIDLVNEAPEIVVNTPAEGAWINNPLVTVQGSAPVGTLLKINNQTVPVGTDGSFRFDVLLDEGDQRIQVSATDDVGNITRLERFVRVKTTGPKLELSVADGSTFSDAQLLLAGSTNPGALVLINQRPVSVGALGDFQAAINLTEGDNTILVQARDQAGNTTSLTRRIRYQVPSENSGAERLMRNFNTLPAVTIPLILMLSLLLGFLLYRQNQLAIELTIDSHTFTPGLPQEGKTLTLRLSLNHPAQVTLEVLDQNGEIQATLLDHRRRTARQHTFVWDGYDDFGRPLMAGLYIIKATAGAPPIKVSSAVQVRIEEDPYVYNQPGQVDTLQQHGTASAQAQMRRRLRQNRKRI